MQKSGAITEAEPLGDIKQPLRLRAEPLVDIKTALRAAGAVQQRAAAMPAELAEVGARSAQPQFNRRQNAIEHLLVVFREALLEKRYGWTHNVIFCAQI